MTPDREDDRLDEAIHWTRRGYKLAGRSSALLEELWAARLVCRRLQREFDGGLKLSAELQAALHAWQLRRPM